VPQSKLKIYRAGPAEAPDALRFYATGGTGTLPNTKILEVINSAVRKGTWRNTQQIVARKNENLVGSVPFFTSPGRSVVIAYPAVLHGQPDELRAQLVRASLDAAAEEGAKLCIALIPQRFPHGGSPFLAAGFLEVAVLLNMELDALDLQPPQDNLQWLTYDQTTAPLFEKTFAETLRGSLDCPRLPKVQTPHESLEGHKAAGNFSPDLWLLALRQKTAIGCALVNQLEDPGHFCLVYVGVVPLQRGNAYGQLLVRKATFKAKNAGATKITLNVDELNSYAIRTYKSLGFRPSERTSLFAVAVQPRS